MNLEKNPFSKFKHLSPRPFPYAADMWYGDIYNARIRGDVCNIDPQWVAEMPINSASVLSVTNEIQTIPFQVAKAESMPFLVSVKFVPKNRPELKLEANIYRKEVYEEIQPDSTLTPYFKEKGNILRFDIIAKDNGKRHPFIRAKKFIPWALEMFADKDIRYCMGEWEPDSDNHATFHRGLEEGLNGIDAIKATWTFQQYAACGFGDIRAISTTAAHSLGKKSPYGYPPDVVHVLFGRDS